MWALGAVISFIATHKHKFNSEYEVRNWRGYEGVLHKNLYSKKLVELTDELLSPDPDNRPSAQDCSDESELHLVQYLCVHGKWPVGGSENPKSVHT